MTNDSSGKTLKDILTEMFLGRGQQQAAAGAPGVAKPKGEAQHLGLEQFDRHLNTLLSGRGAVLAGRVHLLGLERFRADFGDKWDEVAEKVLRYAQQAIEKYLTEADAYTQYGDLKFLIAFGDITEDEAKLRSSFIRDELIRLLKGEGGSLENLDVNTAVTNIDSARLVNSRFGIDFVARLLELAQERLAARAAAQPPSADAAASGAAAPAQGGGLPAAASPAFDPPPEEEDEGSLILVDAAPEHGFIYSPMWDVRHQAISTYRCLPMCRLPSGAIRMGYRVLGVTAGDEAVHELDLTVVKKVAGDLMRLAREDRVLLMEMSMSVKTLLLTDSRQRFIEIFQRIPKDLRRFVILELVHVNVDTPASRLLQVVAPLASLCRSVLLRLPLETGSFEKWRASGIYGVGVDLDGNSRDEARLIDDMSRFVKNAGRQGFRTYALGLATTSLATAAVAAGFDYIDGAAINTMIERPEHVYRFSLDNLFSDAPAIA